MSYGRSGVNNSGSDYFIGRKIHGSRNAILQIKQKAPTAELFSCYSSLIFPLILRHSLHGIGRSVVEAYNEELRNASATSYAEKLVVVKSIEAYTQRSGKTTVRLSFETEGPQTAKFLTAEAAKAQQACGLMENERPIRAFDGSHPACRVAETVDPLLGERIVDIMRELWPEGAGLTLSPTSVCEAPQKSAAFR